MVMEEIASADSLGGALRALLTRGARAWSRASRPSTGAESARHVAPIDPSRRCASEIDSLHISWGARKLDLRRRVVMWGVP
jgi:hypothetical protein